MIYLWPSTLKSEVSRRYKKMLQIEGLESRNTPNAGLEGFLGPRNIWKFIICIPLKDVMLRWSAQLLLAAENEISVAGSQLVGRAHAFSLCTQGSYNKQL